MLWRMFDPSEPALETGDDRAKVEGSQCVTISSPLDILLVVAPGASTNQPLQFFGLRGGGGAGGEEYLLVRPFANTIVSTVLRAWGG